MAQRLNILMISSECVPFAKTGGLADVVGALPKALQTLGHHVIVVMPRYAAIDLSAHHATPHIGSMGVWMGDSQEWCAVHQTSLEGGVPVYLVEYNRYFDRSGLYHDELFQDYADNPRRFGFLTRAALQLCRDSGFRPDIVHVHDWQTALAPAYLKLWHWDDPVLGGAASVLTIHNIGYQGKYPATHLDYLGLGWHNLTTDRFEDHGAINFLKAGIHYADIVNTVSPTYANETRSPEMGWGLAPYLNDKGDRYLGILNGVDYSQWSPDHDLLIPATYSVGQMTGKAACKAELQRRFSLEVKPNTPLVGIVSRLVQQKGLELLAASVEEMVRTMTVQLVILGTGDQDLEAFYDELPSRYAGQIGSHIGYSNELAHWIEAGSDFFLMPSLYEPCGLNQIYSLRYGTLPIVRATGGLDDTIEQYQEASGEGTGFKFWDPTPDAVLNTVGWAVSTYYDRPHHMETMIQRAMSQDFSWDQSASAYQDAYGRAIEIKRAL